MYVHTFAKNLDIVLPLFVFAIPVLVIATTYMPHIVFEFSMYSLFSSFIYLFCSSGVRNFVCQRTYECKEPNSCMKNG